jgi:5S rRNA maturation endonuclease (ribonuclease M5)
VSTFSQSTRDYLDAHAIDPALAATVGVHERAGQLRFPNVAPDGSIYHRERSLNGGPKVTQPKGQPLDLWWPLGRRDTEAAIICEGESDALAALEPLSKSRFAALEVASVPGTGYMVERLVEQLAEAGTREVFLAFDGDTAGRAYTAKAEAALRDAGIRSIVVDLEDGTDLADNLVRAADRTRWIENALADAEATVDETESSPAGLEPSSPSPRANTPAWPDPPAEAAFHGLAGDIVRTIEPHSEADPRRCSSPCSPPSATPAGGGRASRSRVTSTRRTFTWSSSAPPRRAARESHGDRSAGSSRRPIPSGWASARLAGSQAARG